MAILSSEAGPAPEITTGEKTQSTLDLTTDISSRSSGSMII